MCIIQFRYYVADVPSGRVNEKVWVLRGNAFYYVRLIHQGVSLDSRDRPAARGRAVIGASRVRLPLPLQVKPKQNTTKMIQITKEEAKVGDYVYVDGYSSFCTGSKERIRAFETRYNSKTGEPYEVVVTTDGVFRKDNGSSIKGATAYSIFGYYREDDDLKEKKKRLKSLKLKVAAKRRKAAQEVVDVLKSIEIDGIKIKLSSCYGDLNVSIETDLDKEINKLQDEIDRELY